MNAELMRIIDGICRDKNIERETMVNDIEGAMTTALRKQYGEDETTFVRIDHMSGNVQAQVAGQPIDVKDLGRIAAQAAKQMIIQKTRDRERVSIYDEFSQRRGTIITGTVIRAEGGNLLINIGRTEGFLPRSEQIPGETHQPGERIRALILEVREQANQVKIILSRSHPELIIRLFELEVPEVAEHIIEIKALAREAGYRTKVAVSSIDTKVDAVGACVGVRGSRIRNIVDELGGEKIDIVRWNESSQILIQNALKPAEVQEVALCFELGKATVVVAEDQLSLAIGKRGQNVRLASRLTGWDIDILTPAEYTKHLESMARVLKSVTGVDDLLVDKLVALGCVSVEDVDQLDPQTLATELEIELAVAEQVIEAAGEEVILVLEKKEAEAKARAEAIARGEIPPDERRPRASVPAVGETAGEVAAGGETPSGFVADAPPTDDAAEAPGEEPLVTADGEAVPAGFAAAAPAADEVSDTRPAPAGEGETEPQASQ